MTAAARVVERAPEGWWELLAEDPAATPAHRPDLWSALGEACSEWSPCYVTVADGGESLGGTPAAVLRRGGLRWLHVLPFMLTGAPLARPGAHAEVDDRVASALEGLRERLGAAGGVWTLYRPAGVPPAAPAFERVAGETRALETTLIELDDHDAPLLSRAEKSVRMQARSAEASGLSFAEEPEALEPVLALHRRQARAWPGHRPPPIDLLRRLLARAAPREDRAGRLGPPARLFTVRDRGRLLCGAFVLDHPREAFAWWSGAAHEARAVHAGTYLCVGLMRWARSAGRARLNLGSSPRLLGAAAFKRALGGRSVSYPVRWLAPASGTWLTRGVAAVERAVRRGRFRGDPA